MALRDSGVAVKVVDTAPLTTIRIKESLRDKLRCLKKGNPDRNKGVDTYDDVIERLISNGV